MKRDTAISRILTNTRKTLKEYFYRNDKEYIQTIYFWHMRYRELKDREEFDFWIHMEFKKILEDNIKIGGDCYAQIQTCEYFTKGAEADEIHKELNNMKKPRMKKENIEIKATNEGNLLYLTIIFNHKGVKNGI